MHACVSIGGFLRGAHGAQLLVAAGTRLGCHGSLLGRLAVTFDEFIWRLSAVLKLIQQ